MCIRDSNEALASGNVEQLKQVIGSDPEALAKAVSAPVGVERIAVFPVEDFGSAMAPLYTTLAPVSYTHLQFARIAVPDGEREHAAQAVEHAFAPCQIACEQDFGVGVGLELPALRLKLGAQVAVVDVYKRQALIRPSRGTALRATCSRRHIRSLSMSWPSWPSAGTSRCSRAYGRATESRSLSLIHI